MLGLLIVFEFSAAGRPNHVVQLPEACRGTCLHNHIQQQTAIPLISGNLV